MSLEYAPQMIELSLQEQRTIKVEAMVATGTGLAYHLVVGQPDLYAVTHSQSGYAITELTMPTEPEIQAFLEKVAALDPDRWQINLVTLKRRHTPRIRAQIELAHYDARSPYSVFMYAEYADGDATPESFDAVADPQAPSNLALVSSIFSREEMLSRVHLVRMHEGTGEHESVHVYERMGGNV